MPLSPSFIAATDTITPFSATTVMRFRTRAFSVSTTCTFVSTCRGAGGRSHGADTMSKSTGTGFGTQCGGSQSSGAGCAGWAGCASPASRSAETAADADACSESE